MMIAEVNITLVVIDTKVSIDIILSERDNDHNSEDYDMM